MWTGHCGLERQNQSEENWLNAKDKLLWTNKGKLSGQFDTNCPDILGKKTCGPDARDKLMQIIKGNSVNNLSQYCPEKTVWTGHCGPEIPN